MDHDVIIIGGGFAGLAAAMPLVRARRRVLLIDAGQPRNRFADASHGFLGQDGVAPAEIQARGRRELSAYPTFTAIDGMAVQAAGEMDHFTVTEEAGSVHRARRLILALGVRDELPDLPGLRDRWGISALHCPYCHGYEVADRPLGVLASALPHDHRGLLLTDWGRPTILFTHGSPLPPAEMLDRLAARNVQVETAPIAELLGPAPALEAVRLTDDRVLPLAALFIAPKTTLSSPLAAQLGCAMEEGPSGAILRTDGRRATSIPGVFAAGDAVMGMHNGLLAAASGLMAGVGAHQSLVMP
jgi:thioredoxin reductase